MTNKTIIQYKAKNKGTKLVKLRQRIAQGWRNKWLEDDNDVTQNDLDDYKGYDANDQDAFRKIRQTTDYEMADGNKEEDKKGGNKEGGKKFPSYPL